MWFGEVERCGSSLCCFLCGFGSSVEMTLPLFFVDATRRFRSCRTGERWDFSLALLASILSSSISSDVSLARLRRIALFGDVLLMSRLVAIWGSPDRLKPFLLDRVLIAEAIDMNICIIHGAKPSTYRNVST